MKHKHENCKLGLQYKPKNTVICFNRRLNIQYTLGGKGKLSAVIEAWAGWGGGFGIESFAMYWPLIK